MKHPTAFFVVACLSLVPAFAQNEPIPKPPIPPADEASSEKPEPEPAESATPATPVQAKPVEPSKPKEYVVQSGDNPWLIAKNHNVNLQELLTLNDIKDAKNLKVGDVLKLPDGVESKNAPIEAKPVAETEKKAEGPKEGDDWELYTIQKGDNPWKIAKAMQVDHSKIMKLNEGLDFTKLNIGQQIKIPKK